MFSVKVKQIVLKTIDYRFKSDSPHKKILGKQIICGSKLLKVLRSENFKNIDLRIRIKWLRILKLNEHEKAGKPINYIPSSASHNHNVQWVENIRENWKYLQ